MEVRGEKLKRYLEFVWRVVIKDGRGIESIVTVLAAVVVAGIAILSDLFNAQLVASLTLAVLALLAVSVLQIRVRLEQLNESLAQPSLLLRGFPESYRQDLLGSEGPVFLIGVSLYGWIRDNYTALYRRLEAGQSIRVLVVDPYSRAVFLTESRVRGSRSEQRNRNEILGTLGRLANMLEDLPDAQLEVRLTQQVPAFALFSFREGRSDSKLYIEHYPFRADSHEYLHLVLTPTDGFWYRFYVQQAEAMWADGRLIDPRAYLADDRPASEAAAQLSRAGEATEPAPSSASTPNSP